MVSSPVRLPTNRPDLPRASSAMSGFFFCGMIDDPVAQASSSRAQPNSVDVQRHDLLPQPGEVDAEQGRGEAELGGEVAVADGVDRVVRGAVEAELGGDGVGVQRQRRAGQRAGAAAG